MKKLIKVDRNGTKHYHVDECPRCGGTGKYEYTTIDNYRCWKCRGTGYYPHIEKEYTEEYLAKMEAKKRAKELDCNLKKLSANIKRLTPFLSIDKPIYVVKGNTYKIRSELKERGARFSIQIYAWVFDNPTTEYNTIKLNFSDLWFVNRYNLPEPKDGVKKVWEMLEQK